MKTNKNKIIVGPKLPDFKAAELGVIIRLIKGIISDCRDVVLGHAWDAAIDGEDGQK